MCKISMHTQNKMCIYKIIHMSCVSDMSLSMSLPTELNIVVSGMNPYIDYIPKMVCKVGELYVKDDADRSDTDGRNTIQIYFDSMMKSYWYENPDQRELKHFLSLRPLYDNVYTEGKKFHINECPHHVYEFRYGSSGK
jgi:hypothetical protein